VVGDLLSRLAAVRVERVEAGGDLLRITARTRDDASVACAGCGQSSDWVHSRYERHVADEAVGGRGVVIDLSVRRLYCEDPACEKVTFVEQVTGLTRRYQRRTPARRGGLPAVAGRSWPSTRCELRPPSRRPWPAPRVLVRYADDFVVLCHNEAQVHHVRARLEEWPEPRGLRFNEEKTKVVQLEDGFDFLGFTVRRTSGKVIIRPSTTSCKRLRARLRTEVKALNGATAEAVLCKLVPIVRGRAAYYRGVASTTTFASLDRYIWRLTWNWARRSHLRKSRYVTSSSKAERPRTTPS
jgi:hypothetical protein